MMSRGSFNGPGGQHTRFLIPPTQGAALGSQHNMRNKRFLNFIADGDLLRLNRDGLAQSGMAVADVKAREVAPTAARSPACSIALDGAGDNEPPCTLRTTTRPATAWRTTATGTTSPASFNDYTMEVVQQIGSDSFDPGHGVLISKTKNRQLVLRHRSAASSGHRRPPAGHQPGRLRQGRRHAEEGDDRRRAPDSTTASFNAGLNSGSTYEYEADGQPPALLHHRQAHGRATGILHYTVGVTSLDGAGPQTRGVALGRARRRAPPRATRPARSRSRTRARRRPIPADVHPQDAVGVPRQRRLPPVGVGHRHRLDARTSRTRSPPRSSARRSRSRSTSRRPPTRPPPARSR